MESWSSIRWRRSGNRPRDPRPERARSLSECRASSRASRRRVEGSGLVARDAGLVLPPVTRDERSTRESGSRRSELRLERTTARTERAARRCARDSARQHQYFFLDTRSGRHSEASRGRQENSPRLIVHGAIAPHGAVRESSGSVREFAVPRSGTANQRPRKFQPDSARRTPAHATSPDPSTPSLRSVARDDRIQNPRFTHISSVPAVARLIDTSAAFRC